MDGSNNNNLNSYADSIDSSDEKTTPLYYIENKPTNNELVDTTEYVGSISMLSRIFNPSTILGLVAATLLIIGLTTPIMDFRAFNDNIDIQYNLMKICKNVRIISPIWNGLPYGVIVGIAILIILSFINIPVLKIIPFVLIVLMYAIMLVDLGNVIDWANDFIQSYAPITQTGIAVKSNNIIDGIMSGAYFTVGGIVLMLVSCFVKGAKEK